MSDHTKIEWTDATANVINGCTVKSAGCTNCYAMKQAHRFPVRRGLTKQSNGGMVWTGEVRFNEAALLQVLKWKKPRMIFWNAHGDMFHENVPDEWIDRCFAVMALTPHHTHQVLTKRADRMRSYCEDTYQMRERIGEEIVYLPMPRGGWECIDWESADERASLNVWPLPNVWLGVSVENQAAADERIPDLLATPAAVRWISAEPLIGQVDLFNVARRVEGDMNVDLDALRGFATVGAVDGIGGYAVPGPKLDWVVCGGESGAKARGSTDEVEAWMRDILIQCEAADVPFFGKQNFKKAPLPADLDVKEYPHAR